MYPWSMFFGIWHLELIDNEMKNKAEEINRSKGEV